MKQNTKTSSLLAIALIAGLGSLGTATAATIIAGIGVDIGDGATFAGTGVLGESFIAVPGANQTNTVIGTNGAGNVTLSFNSSHTGSSGYSGPIEQTTAGSPNNLFGDSVGAGNDNPGTGTITFTISGLTANALYFLGEIFISVKSLESQRAG